MSKALNTSDKWKKSLRVRQQTWILGNKGLIKIWTSCTNWLRSIAGQTKVTSLKSSEENGQQANSISISRRSSKTKMWWQKTLRRWTKASLLDRKSSQMSRLRSLRSMMAQRTLPRTHYHILTMIRNKWTRAWFTRTLMKSMAGHRWNSLCSSTMSTWTDSNDCKVDLSISKTWKTKTTSLKIPKIWPKLHSTKMKTSQRVVQTILIVIWKSVKSKKLYTRKIWSAKLRPSTMRLWLQNWK